jgi:hypothetical protein
MARAARRRLAIVRGFLFDVGGVRHRGRYPVPGATEPLRDLAAVGIPFRLFTRTTTASRASLMARPCGMGIPICERHRPGKASSSATGRILPTFGTGPNKASVLSTDRPAEQMAIPMTAELTEDVITEAMARAETVAWRPGDDRRYPIPDPVEDARASLTALVVSDVLSAL